MFCVPVTGGGFRCGGCTVVLATLDSVAEHQRRVDGGRECVAKAKERARCRAKAARNYVPAREVRECSSVTEALDSFGKAMRYGPSFPCIVCHGLSFRHEVVEADRVGGLEAGGPRRVRYVDRKYVAEKNGMFVRLEREWCCLPCRQSIVADRMPALAAVNKLEPTWSELPDELVRLTALDVELLALLHVFGHADGLSDRVYGVGGPTKSLHYVRPEVADVAGMPDVRDDFLEVMHGLHARPAGQPAVVSASPVRNGWRRMLDGNPLYRVGLSPRGTANWVVTMFDDSPQLAYLDSSTEAASQLATAQWRESVDNWTAAGPRFVQLDGVILPTKSPLPERFRRLAEVRSLYAKCGGGHHDLGNAAGIDTPRAVHISPQQWLRSRLSNARRDGPTQQAQLLLALVAQTDARQLVAAGAAPDGWRKHAGSQEYWATVRADIAASAEWRGPPSFYLTFSTNVECEDVQAAMKAIEGGASAGLTGAAQRTTDVWHTADETRLLKRRRRVGAAAESSTAHGYYVHTVTDVKNGTCPFHTNCDRTRLRTDTRVAGTPADLHTLARISDHQQSVVLDRVLRVRATGICLDAHKAVTEVQPSTGIPHTHVLGWLEPGTELAATLRRLQAGSAMQREELYSVESLGAGAITATLDPSAVFAQFGTPEVPDESEEPGEPGQPAAGAEEPAVGDGLTREQANLAVDLAKRLQRHVCVDKCKCRTEDGTCWYGFPQLPCLLSGVVSRRQLGEAEWARQQCGAVAALHKRVRARLTADRYRIETGVSGETPASGDFAALVEILRTTGGVGGQVKSLPDGGHEWAGIQLLPTNGWSELEWNRLGLVLLQLGCDPVDLTLMTAYHASLEVSIDGAARYLTRRRVRDSFTNGFNPSVLLATRANMDVQLALRTSACLYGYVTKSGSDVSSVEAAVRELRRRGDNDAAAKSAARQLEEAVEAGCREVSLTEAIYRSDSRLSMVNSRRTRVAYVPTAPGNDSRVKRAYIGRPAELDHMCLAQWAQWYRPAESHESGRDSRRAEDGGRPTVVSVDGPAIDLPDLVVCEGGGRRAERWRRLREPRPVDHGPRGSYGRLAMYRAWRDADAQLAPFWADPAEAIREADRVDGTGEKIVEGIRRRLGEQFVAACRR